MLNTARRSVAVSTLLAANFVGDLLNVENYRRPIMVILSAIHFPRVLSAQRTPS
jgi:hypothetical protein